MPIHHIEHLLHTHRIEFIDLRFADLHGLQHHITYPVSIVNAKLFESQGNRVNEFAPRDIFFHHHQACLRDFVFPHAMPCLNLP